MSAATDNTTTTEVRAPARPIVRSFGDTAAEYDAARTRAIVVDRADRSIFRIFGREPVRMVHGLVTNDVQNLQPGGHVHAGMLTPKGRLLADVRVIRRTDDLLIECDTAAASNVSATMKKYVPPLFAKAEDGSASLAVLGLYGPAAPRILEQIPIDAGDHVLATDFTGDPGFDIVCAMDRHESLQHAAVAAGARLAGHAVLDVLRIEAGMPRWGAELDEQVIPIEAGLTERMISTTKGCYTGQEVIIRILHRGHVNRHLRGLLLGDGPTPVRGQELFLPGAGRSVGRITSACLSPRHRRAIALGYVRREVEPGATLHVGAADGPAATMVALPFPDAQLSGA